MEKSDDSLLEDWGGYEPETQKALRFIVSLAGVGAARQIAQAIDREYVARSLPGLYQLKPIRPRRKKEVQKELTLEELRLEAGMSQAALARAANIDRITYVRAESGSPVQDTTAYAIAEALSEVLDRKIDFRLIQGLEVVSK